MRGALKKAFSLGSGPNRLARGSCSFWPLRSAKEAPMINDSIAGNGGVIHVGRHGVGASASYPHLRAAPSPTTENGPQKSGYAFQGLDPSFM